MATQTKSSLTVAMNELSMALSGVKYAKELKRVYSLRGAAESKLREVLFAIERARLAIEASKDEEV